MPVTIELDRQARELPDLLSSGRKSLFLERRGQRVGAVVTPHYFDQLELQESVDESDEWTEEDLRDFSTSSWALVNRRLDEDETSG